MINESSVVVKCRISRGGFSSERVFRLTLADGSEHVGAAPVEYFFDEGRRQLSSDMPAKGTSMGGFVTARILGGEGEGVLVSVPSGEVLAIPASEIPDHPRESRAHVPV